MPTTIYLGHSNVLSTGANGPYVYADPTTVDPINRPVTLWTQSPSGSSVVVTRSSNGGTSPVPVDMAQQGTDPGYFENTGTIVGDLGELTLTVTGPGPCTWGIL